MKIRVAAACIAGCALALALPLCGRAQSASPAFTLQQILSYPYPVSLIAGADNRTIAWVLNERGVRNIFVASAPSYAPRMVTDYTADDGQEITNVKISADGRYLVYVRGGDHDSNWPARRSTGSGP